MGGQALLAVPGAQVRGTDCISNLLLFAGGGIPSHQGLAQILAQDGCVCTYLGNSFPPGCVEYVGRGKQQRVR